MPKLPELECYTVAELARYWRCAPDRIIQYGIEEKLRISVEAGDWHIVYQNVDRTDPNNPVILAEKEVQGVCGLLDVMPESLRDLRKYGSAVITLFRVAGWDEAYIADSPLWYAAAITESAGKEMLVARGMDYIEALEYCRVRKEQLLISREAVKAFNPPRKGVSSSQTPGYYGNKRGQPSHEELSKTIFGEIVEEKGLLSSKAKMAEEIEQRINADVKRLQGECPTLKKAAKPKQILKHISSLYDKHKKGKSNSEAA